MFKDSVTISLALHQCPRGGGMAVLECVQSLTGVSTNERSSEAGMSWWQGERQGIRDELLGMVGCCKVLCTSHCR